MTDKVAVWFKRHDIGGWSVSVEVDGASEGWASGPSFASVFDLASDILFPACDVGCIGLGPSHKCEPLVAEVPA